MLTLPIKKKWFDMIVNGEKKEEYRDCSPYYVKRFINLKRTMIDGHAQAFLCLRNGYSKTSPTCFIRCWVDMGEGRAEWGASPGVQYIRLHITKVEKARH